MDELLGFAAVAEEKFVWNRVSWNWDLDVGFGVRVTWNAHALEDVVWKREATHVLGLWGAHEVSFVVGVSTIEQLLLVDVRAVFVVDVEIFSVILDH